MGNAPIRVNIAAQFCVTTRSIHLPGSNADVLFHTSDLGHRNDLCTSCTVLNTT